MNFKYPFHQVQFDELPVWQTPVLHINYFLLFFFLSPLMSNVDALFQIELMPSYLGMTAISFSGLKV
jgi:hypothetical protein